MMAATGNWPSAAETKNIWVIQGEYKLSADRYAVLSTVLGSCVSVCLFDKVAGVGGMNHYLLPEGGSTGAGDVKYGANAMELLINGLLRKGATRQNIKAKIFGGARMTASFQDIGQRNGEFAIKFLGEEGFPIEARDLGGTSARRVMFHPFSGSARTSVSEGSDPAVAAPAPKPAPKPQSAVTLF